MTLPFVTIIVVNYKTPKQIKLCLRSLRFFTRCPHEVVVVDNRSEDESFEYLQSLRWIRLLQNPAPEPTHRNALDLAIAATQSEWILCLHSDTFVRSHGWLEALLSYRDPETKLVASADRVVMPMNNLFDHAKLWWTRRKQRKRWAKRGLPPKLISHCTLLHRSLFDEHGLCFDMPKYVDGVYIDCGEGIQRYCEDKKLAIRWLGREDLGPLLWHFEAATLNLVTGRRLPWKRRWRAKRFYQRPEIIELLNNSKLDRDS